jgi:predicted RNase H-like HicB family nuclease
MRYAFVIEKTETNFSAYVPDLPGCVATGATVEEVEREIRDAISFHLEGMRPRSSTQSQHGLRGQNHLQAKARHYGRMVWNRLPGTLPRVFVELRLSAFLLRAKQAAELAGTHRRRCRHPRSPPHWRSAVGWSPSDAGPHWSGWWSGPSPHDRVCTEA